MLIFKDIKSNLLMSSSLALGMFDGVHIGHQKVICNAIKESEKLGTIPTVVTFEKHPLSVITNNKVEYITTLEDRLEKFKKLGVKAVALLNFDSDLSKMSASEYLSNVLINSFNPKSITVGFNHKFGACKKGDGSFLKEYGEKYNFKVNITPPVEIENYSVSSSLIREMIRNGDVETANKLISTPFSLNNKVIRGMQRGRLMGYPTANIEIPKSIVSPACGVYLGAAELNGRTYKTIINVGKRPTFSDLVTNLVEAHLFHFNSEIYGCELKLSFLKKIRDEKKFNSLEDLKKQIDIDCKVALQAE